MRSTWIPWLLLIGCFDPKPTPGQSCVSWCPPPETCIAGTCTTTAQVGDGPAPIQGNYMFVTGEMKTPVEIGGLAGGDAWCNQLAHTANLAGHYTAWLSSSAESAHDRLAATGARGWYRTDGKPFADTLDSIVTTGTTFYPPSVTETGANLTELDPVDAEAEVATGSTGGGGDAPGFDCDGFTSSTGSYAAGYFDAGKYTWTAAASDQQCASAVRIYCFGDNENRYAVTPTPQTGVRRAFVTKMGVASGGGLAGMDSACTSNATMAGLPGTFKAWLPTISASADSRFTMTTPWVRTDEVTTIAADFSSMLAPLDVDAFGTYHSGGSWGGPPHPTDKVSTNAFDCFDWTVTGPGAIVSAMGEVSRGTFSGAFGFSTYVPCNNTLYLYCLQQ